MLVASIDMIEPPICLNECSSVWTYVRRVSIRAYVHIPLHSLETTRGWMISFLVVGTVVCHSMHSTLRQIAGRNAEGAMRKQ